MELEDEESMGGALPQTPLMRACPNPSCTAGYAPRGAQGGLRVCPACDGFGYLRGVSENRKRYYNLRSVTAELELQSRTRRNAVDEGAALDVLLGDAILAGEAQNEGDCVIPQGGQCRRLS